MVSFSYVSQLIFNQKLWIYQKDAMGIAKEPKTARMTAKSSTNYCKKIGKYQKDTDVEQFESKGDVIEHKRSTLAR